MLKNYYCINGASSKDWTIVRMSEIAIAKIILGKFTSSTLKEPHFKVDGKLVKTEELFSFF